MYQGEINTSKRSFYRVKELCGAKVKGRYANSHSVPLYANRRTAQLFLEGWERGETKYGKPFRTNYFSRQKKGEVYRMREDGKWIGLCLVTNEMVVIENVDWWGKARVMFMLSEEGVRLLKTNLLKVSM